MKRVRNLLWLSAAVPALALADWAGKGELGAAQSTANTGATTSTLAAKFDLAKEDGQWKHAFGVSTVYTAAKSEASLATPDPQNETTAKRWEGHEQTDYKFGDHAFWFGAGRYEHDSIGSVVYRAVLSTGLGYKFIDNEQTKLSAQLGAGYKRFRKDLERSDSEAVGTASVELKQVLSANTVLTDKLALETGASDTVMQNDLALQVKMSDVLALALGHQVRYYTKPGVNYLGREYAKSDRLLTVNLVYEFKVSVLRRPPSQPDSEY